MSDRNTDEPHNPNAPQVPDDAAYADGTPGEYTSAPQSGPEGDYTSVPPAEDNGHYTDAEPVDQPSNAAVNDFAEETPGFTPTDTTSVPSEDTEPYKPGSYSEPFDSPERQAFNDRADSTDRAETADRTESTSTRVLPPELVQPAEPERPTAVIPPTIPASAAAASAVAAPAASVDRSQYVIKADDDAPQTARTTAVEPARNTATEQYYAPRGDAADAAFARPPQRIVYVDAPTPPRKKGNRGVGALIALASSIVFAILFAAVIFVLYYGTIGRVATNFVAERSFYVPVILFAIGFIILVLILNRAKWGAYVFGSIFVGLFVYLGTIGTLLLFEGLIEMTPTQAAAAFTGALNNPLVIAAGLLGREVSLWLGAAISARGRRVKAKNIEAQAAFERETEARRVEHERANTAPASY